MADNVRAPDITQARPPGPNQQVRLEARYALRDRVIDTLGNSEIRRALTNLQGRIKKVISESIARSYAASGLARQHNKLYSHATVNFHVEVDYSSGSGIVDIRAIWHDPQIPYFYIHLFGGIIRAKRAKYLVFRTADGKWHSKEQVIMPARPYLELDRDAANQIKAIIDDSLEDRLRMAVRGEGPEEPREPAMAAMAATPTGTTARTVKIQLQGIPSMPRAMMPSMRMTPHRMRAIIRRQLKVTPDQARSLWQRFGGKRMSESMLASILRKGLTTIEKTPRFSVRPMWGTSVN